MEAFARGIQAVLAKDWTVLVDSFIETGFFGNPIMSLYLMSLYLCVWHMSLPFRLDKSQLYWACLQVRASSVRVMCASRKRYS